MAGPSLSCAPALVSTWPLGPTKFCISQRPGSDLSKASGARASVEKNDGEVSKAFTFVLVSPLLPGGYTSMHGCLLWTCSSIEDRTVTLSGFHFVYILAILYLMPAAFGLVL